MPTYHFNVHDGTSFPDLTGHELANLEAAKAEAVVLAGGLIREMGPSFWKGEEWRMDVTNSAGLMLFSLYFTGIVAAAGRNITPANI